MEAKKKDADGQAGHLSVTENGAKRKRYALLDSIRGITLLSMILYHGAWDLVYLYHVKWDSYRGTGAYIWQQSICWTFILLSGFCWSLGRKHFKRGLMVFGGGFLVTIATLLVMPQNRVVFGVLTLTGSCMLIMIFADRLLKKAPAQIGVVISFLLFVLTRNVNEGYLGFESLRLMKLPGMLYRGYLGAYLGFPPGGFYSTDYFSLIPWLFLFVTGYFLYHIFYEKKLLEKKIFSLDVKPFSFLGRHSLMIYLLHQPLLYLLGMMFF